MANLLDEINKVKGLICNLRELYDSCTKTRAGQELKAEIKPDLDELYCKLGRLVSNSAVKICLQ